ncbi:NNP family nitrate/nitrite transporter-like MFS transporter [Streptomyces sp. B3I7]|uniref:MFS transporter n=1 Tax=Streptomyces sp. B3I7 TaxID=3042269 RepID=UPI0027813313|nr:nitrate/nitrite transporter [Streptomyces sp. B3I7]MDQ0808650.1 NNP family nitrate/nitrite transporter-like MFS transporter [Streptomyces sp. B3I7]
MTHRPRKGVWLVGWDPEDEDAWERYGRRLARRNLVLSVLGEHIGFSVWTLWSVLVLFMSPDIGLGFDAGDKFLLVATPTVVGALLRLPYGFAVTRYGGRDWTVFATGILLVPTLLALYFVQRPGTPLWVFLIVAALSGVGGGNFASSMTNITALYPQRHQGWALGLNAGGGNLGVAAVQLVGLTVISVAGRTHPSYVAAACAPVIVLVALLAAWRMDNVDAVRAAPGTQREAARDQDTWWISLLYIGTFGSFIGYGFAFGLVLQNEFDAGPVDAVGYTFLGPLLGSVARPLGGLLADRLGGARVTFWNFLGMGAGTLLLLGAAEADSFALFVAGFTALFVLSGIGNGSTYKMIPAVFAGRAREEIAAGQDADAAFARARRLSGAVIAIAGAVGALGGAAIDIAFSLSYADGSGSGAPAFLAFLGYYVLCMVLIRAVHLRRRPVGHTAPADRAEAASHV